MSNIEIKKRQGRWMGVIIFLTGLSLTIITALLNAKRESTQETTSLPHDPSFNWIPAIGVAVMITGAILFWKSFQSSR